MRKEENPTFPTPHSLQCQQHYNSQQQLHLHRLCRLRQECLYRFYNYRYQCCTDCTGTNPVYACGRAAHSNRLASQNQFEAVCWFVGHATWVRGKNRFYDQLIVPYNRFDGNLTDWLEGQSRIAGLVTLFLTVWLLCHFCCHYCCYHTMSPEKSGVFILP